MSINIEAIKSKIQKLLNLAHDDAASLNEADNALRFARRLMLNNNVSESDIAELKSKDPHEVAADVEYGTADFWSMGKSLSTWESTLAHAIADLVGTVKWFYRANQTKRTKAGLIQYDEKGRSKESTKLIFYGPEEDCQDAQALLAEWWILIAALARVNYGGCLRGEGRSYAEGYAQALYSKVHNIKHEERKVIANAPGEGGYALIVVTANAIMEAKREKAVDFLEKEHGIKLGRGRSKRAGKNYGDAYGHGSSDGKSAEFTRERKRKIT